MHLREWTQELGDNYRWDTLEGNPLYSSLLLGGLLVMVFSPLQTAPCEALSIIAMGEDIKMSWGGSSQLLNVRAKILLGHKQFDLSNYPDFTNSSGQAPGPTVDKIMKLHWDLMVF